MSSKYDVTQFLTIFDPLLPLSRFLLLRPLYCRHKIFEPSPPKTVTTFKDNPLGINLIDRTLSSSLIKFYSIFVLNEKIAKIVSSLTSGSAWGLQGKTLKLDWLQPWSGHSPESRKWNLKLIWQWDKIWENVHLSIFCFSVQFYYSARHLMDHWY